MNLLKRLFGRSEPVETRASASGLTAEIMAARESYISGRSGLAELTATVQACVSMWEHGLSLADVDGTDLLDRRTMALLGRSLALRGEALFLIDGDRLVPCSDWDLSTRGGRPRAYRLSISEAGGGRSMTALAAEVVHVVIGSDPAAPWLGTSPLRRSSLTAGLLHAVESALAETFELAPLGSQVVPFPESQGADNERLERSFRGRRGRVLLRESVNVGAAGGPMPTTDWRPASLSPNLRDTMALEAMGAARESVAMAYGVLPALLRREAQGPLVREAQRHLAGWTLEPIAALIAEEATAKIGEPVKVDVMRPLQAFDVGGKARAFGAIVEGIGAAKAMGLTAEELQAVLKIVRWDEEVSGFRPY